MLADLLGVVEALLLVVPVLRFTDEPVVARLAEVEPLFIICPDLES